MINITVKGDYIEVTSTSPFSYPFQNGKVSIPVNSIFYKIDMTSNYITFRSVANGDVIFAGDYTTITIDGVLPEEFLETFNSIAFK